MLPAVTPKWEPWALTHGGRVHWLIGGGGEPGLARLLAATQCFAYACCVSAACRNPGMGAMGNGVGLRSQPIYAPSQAVPL